mmetsp:Transcript_5615/g.14318  ORF Transcript_5615/g.14318 Transcript_5615/m.14318 type:complete len:453 (+) Transcript_5615:359-1717(+)
MPFARSTSSRIISAFKKAVTPRSESVQIYVDFDREERMLSGHHKCTFESPQESARSSNESPRVVTPKTPTTPTSPSTTSRLVGETNLGVGSVSRWAVGAWDVEVAANKATSPWCDERQERIPKEKHVRTLVAATKVSEDMNRVVLKELVCLLNVTDVRVLAKTQCVLLRLFAESSRCFLLLCTKSTMDGGMRESLQGALTKASRYDLKNKEGHCIVNKRMDAISESDALKADAARHMAMATAVAKALLARIELSASPTLEGRFDKLAMIVDGALSAISAAQVRLPQRVAKSLPNHAPRGEAEPRLGHPSGLMDMIMKMMVTAVIEVEEEMSNVLERTMEAEPGADLAMMAQELQRKREVIFETILKTGNHQELTGRTWKRWVKMQNLMEEHKKQQAAEKEEEEQRKKIREEEEEKEKRQQEQTVQKKEEQDQQAEMKLILADGGTLDFDLLL